ncbi:MAG TPA: TMEM175 family protein [Candidatus Bathyarchaeia archaeon]|nr:TMEM175 family protein [Candidatus Bathyarchaeia archaeon]
MTSKAPSAYFGKGRVEALADGIFATVMTILVLSLVVPTITGANASESLQADLYGLLPNLFVYVFTFIFLGMLWIGHQNSLSHITKLDLRTLWLNIFLLLSIGLIPFSTALLGGYPLQALAEATYAINGLATSSLFNILWHYPRMIRLAHEEPDREFVKRRTRVLIVGPVVFSVAIIFAFISTYASLALIVFAAIFYLLLGSRYAH